MRTTVAAALLLAFVLGVLSGWYLAVRQTVFPVEGLRYDSDTNTFRRVN